MTIDDWWIDAALPADARPSLQVISRKSSGFRKIVLLAVYRIGWGTDWALFNSDKSIPHFEYWL